MREEIRRQVAEAAAVVRERGDDFPKTAVVLGSGLARGARGVERHWQLPYGSVPGLGECTAPGHRGRLIVGKLRHEEGAPSFLPQLPIALLSGRQHLYEGYSADEVVFGVRLLAALGVERLVLTAATGAIRPDIRPGNFVRITDHLNLTGVSPLEGPEPGPEPRFPDLTEAWDPGLGAALDRAALRISMRLPTGVYAGVRGPHFETPAEVRMLRTLGADVVGMSVVLEAIAARQLGVKIAGLAFASNPAAGTGDGEIDAEAVNEASDAAAPNLARLLSSAAAEPEFQGA